MLINKIWQSANELADCRNTIIECINDQLVLELQQVGSTIGLQKAFSNAYFSKPMMLIIDKFDSLQETMIYDIGSVFWNTYNSFNVQSSLQVHHRTEEEVKRIHHWYARESGQAVEQRIRDSELVGAMILTLEHNEYLDKPLIMKR